METIKDLHEDNMDQVLQLQIKELKDENSRLKQLLRESDERLAGLFKHNTNALEEQYHNLVESANSIILRWNGDGKILFVNDYGLRFFGYTRTEMIGNNVMMLVPVRERSGRDLTNLANEIVEYPENHAQFENENILKSGERVWISWTNKVITDDSGNILETIAIGNDITKLKRAEDEVRIKSIEMEAILSCITSGVLVYDTATRVVHSNNSADRMLMYTQDEKENILSDRIEKHFKVFNEDGRQLGVEEMPAFLAAVKAETVTNKVLMLEGSGQNRWLIINAAPLIVSGKHTGGVLSMLDISSLKRTELLLRQNEERFHALANNISQMAWITDQNGKAIWLNKRWYEYTGVSLQEILDTGSKDLQHPDHAERVRKKFQLSIRSGQAWEDVYPIKGKKGEYRWFLSRAFPIKDEEGKITFWFGTNTDITAQRKAEEMLQQKNIELTIAKEKAEESVRLKTAFIANISHEIRTPMSAIMGFSELLKMPDLSQESQATYIEAIFSGGKRMLNILNDLINISKIEAGKIEIKKEVTDINKLLDELFYFFLPEATKNNIKLKISRKLSQDMSLAETDRTKLSQVITNLIKNALKYTCKGYVEFGCKIKDNAYLFHVKDTGSGIRKEHHEKIFERFEQGEDPKTGVPEGVGLGLAISKAYVEALGGTIWVRSASLKGSCFYFTVPFNKTSMQDNSIINKEDKIFQTLPDTEVLIVEDEDSIYAYLDALLRIKNIKSVHAGNGREAIEAVKTHPNIKLILMDTRMPVMNGLEATIHIKKLKPELPVIMLSAMVNDIDIQEAKKAGCDNYVTKPIDQKDLLNKISYYLIPKI